MDENGKITVEGELDMFLEDGEFAAGVLVQADFSDSKDGGFVEKFRDDRHDLTGKSRVFSFLWIDAEPAEMGDSVFGRALWFVVGELAVVVEESGGRRAVESGPEGGLANGGAAGHRQFFVVIRGAADHVGMRFDVFHP